MRTGIFALVLISIISITSTDVPHENEKLLFSKQWINLVARSSGGAEKNNLSKRLLKMVNPHGSELTADQAQQVEAAAKFLSAFGQNLPFAGIARLMLDDNTEEENNVLKTLQYALTKRGIAGDFSKFVEEKIEPVNEEREGNLDAIKKVFNEKSDKHPVKQLLERMSTRYFEQQFRPQQETVGKFRELKEMIDKFKTVREHLAANRLN